MSFFRRAGITIRCACRGAVLAVPDRDVLLDACEPGQRRRLQACLATRPIEAPVWSVHWGKTVGDALYPNDIIAVLRRDDIVVELAYAQKGFLAEMLTVPGVRVALGTRLGRLERRAKSAAAPEPPSNAILRQFVSRQRRDAELIAALHAELARLQAELSVRRPPADRSDRPVGTVADPKFTRLKHEFSKRYHPDAAPPGDVDRVRRARVFQEFWPIVEEIERS
jgi:pyruvate/2-oxoglutarate dehydrogenase complex dihydrolipoamide acyltransferase (E2) component